jgi:DNA polymerase-1
MGRRLITVKTDVELPVACERPALEGRKTRRARRAVRQIQLPHLAAGTPGRKQPQRSAPITEPAIRRPPPARAPLRNLLDEAALDRWLDKLRAAELICLDTETTSLDPMRGATGRHVVQPWKPGTAAYLPLAHHYAGAPDATDLDATLARLQTAAGRRRRPRSART